VTITTNPRGRQADPPAADHPTNHPSAPAGDGSPDDLTLRTPAQLLRLTVAHPSVGVCVVAVEGELDGLTVLLLDTCIREQLTAVPTHLILDLQPVRFLSCRGLTCLLTIRELAKHTGSQLHLAGLVTRVVARPLEITELLGLFDTYPTLTHALAALIRHRPASPHVRRR